MKRFFALGAAIAALGLISTANAADMPTKAPAIAAAHSSSWTGCYLGGNIGAAWARTGFTDETGEFAPVGNDVGSSTGSGFVGGGQAGCDYQFAPNWVVGIRGMWDGASYHQSTVIAGAGGGDFFKTDISSFGMATGRLGYVFDPAMLLYVNAGIGWVDERYHTVCNFGFCASHAETADSTRTGFALGGGAEYKFAPNWSVFLEYDHIFLGSKNTTFAIDNGQTYVERVRQSFDLALVGFNYRFGMQQ